jgi:uncharacterized membrane protein
LLLQREKKSKEREIITITGTKQMDRRLSAPPASWEADRATTKQLDNSIQVSGGGGGRGGGGGGGGGRLQNLWENEH